ncbi:formylglycine-generating enzyme family protein [Flavivirga spongiicola]|uniref:Formylglycine-generating enzyme family protein n=1 Tax=Flavivirga spongiicola TaxID=421621 RepID=A0ABU7XUR8_9FLAO|nr:SUMF1/EgtB/PvdO family nonheme iron enzyme [Flavivirga sp. MEBiC05379]MDO5979524.1 SUMF1/EgtB/PvdO family nonheme iron enzyme [Flavivirga sp. MEBiC05379]
MRLKYFLKLGIPFVIVFQAPLIIAQNFNNYTQDLKGEKITIEMVAVKGGSFLMGADTNDSSRKDDEKPSHEVEVDDFWMGKYEITWEQYDAFVFGEFGPEQFKNIDKLNALGIDAVSGATPPYVDMSFNMGKENHPAVNMTQYAAIMYCKWLTSKTGVFYRLPTEAEWEYACKKGKTDEASNLKNVAWFNENTKDKYEKTGLKEVNNLGIHDLLGNVSEWVMDQYDADYYQSSPQKNPWNKPSELYPRIVRGGSWKDTKDKLCCTSRGQSKQKWKRRDPQIPKSDWWHTNAPFVGFRVVRPKIQPSKEAIKTYWLSVIEDYGLN